MQVLEKIAIVIVTHNAKNYLEDCISNLHDEPLLNIVVVDNASIDGTVEIIKESYSKVSLISLEQNLGFGQANNVGISYALSAGAEYVLLLNQDAQISMDCIDKLIRTQKENPVFGVLSPVHLADFGKVIDSNFSGFFSQKSCPGLLFDLFQKNELKSVYSIEFVNAAIWLLSKECILKVGGFDPVFFMYGEDRDYLHRVVHHGFKVGVCPSLFAFHNRSQGRSGFERNNKINQEYNRLILDFKKLPENTFYRIRLFLKIISYAISPITYFTNAKFLLLAQIKFFNNYLKIRSSKHLSFQTYCPFLSLDQL